MLRWLMAFIYFCILFATQVSSTQRKQYFAVPFMAAKSNEYTEKTVATTTQEPEKKNCMCSKIYDPVCGSNGQSYYNLCQLECENKNGTVFVKHQGNCIPF
ncbi:turripeptide Pal9.2-like [Vanessa cardui]|uniref:turripeptide Pal9.2-like n=1 Tax=Vanessa cardui TaxID=171605 RepID=UPI001F12BCDF|nr:turripeptide Pal9.2-like [Vanessa cardui]